MANNAITTITAKRKMLLARAGAQTLPQIAKMAFGNAGENETGVVTEPLEGQTALNSEIYRKEIDGYEIVNDTQIKYICTLAPEELAGQEISELALVDTDGDLLAIKNFKAVEKNGEFEMTFKVNDVM